MLNEKTIIRDASSEAVKKKENTITVKDAMGLNRHARRVLGKINGGIKIPGTMKPYIRPKQNAY